MGSGHFRELRSTLIGRADTVTGHRDNVVAHLGALHWEGPKGEEFRRKQDANVRELEDVIEEALLAASYAGEVADEIDRRMAQLRNVVGLVGDGAQYLWDGSGQLVSVVSDGVQYTLDGLGNFIGDAGQALGTAWDSTLGRWM